MRRLESHIKVSNGKIHFAVVPGVESHLLYIEDSPPRVRGILVLRGVADQTFFIGEGHKGRCDSVPLIIDEDLHLAVLHHTNATDF